MGGVRDVLGRERGWATFANNHSLPNTHSHRHARSLCAHSPPTPPHMLPDPTHKPSRHTFTRNQHSKHTTTHLSPLRFCSASAKTLSVTPTNPRSISPLTGPWRQGAAEPSATAIKPRKRAASASCLCIATTCGVLWWSEGMNNQNEGGGGQGDKCVTSD